ncbi:hypothetical protein [Candidatus Palauibacter sp.]|uniref:hypothetical protein n=1 Tax=Candidatus Palauibacter sp. TaxID=3101350 RepID=UPI003CC64DDD
MVTEDEIRFLLAPRAPLRRVSASGEIVDTLTIVERPLSVFTIVREIDRNWWGVRMEHPLGPWGGESWLPVAVTPDGSTVVLVGEVRDDGEDASFDLLRIGSDGDTVLHRTIPYKRRPVLPSEEAGMREAFAASVAGDFTPESRGLPISRQESERRRRIGHRLIRFPKYHPPVRRVVAGGDGSTWLLRETGPSPADIWEVYDEQGELEGSVRVEGSLPGAGWGPRLHILRASRAEVWGTTLGEFNVAYVHRYRVNRTCN